MTQPQNDLSTPWCGSSWWLQGNIICFVLTIYDNLSTCFTYLILGERHDVVRWQGSFPSCTTLIRLHISHHRSDSESTEWLWVTRWTVSNLSDCESSHWLSYQSECESSQWSECQMLEWMSDARVTVNYRNNCESPQWLLSPLEWMRVIRVTVSHRSDHQSECESL